MDGPGNEAPDFDSPTPSGRVPHPLSLRRLFLTPKVEGTTF